ncbi:MAG: hypothetical protein AB7H77_12070, partial [Bdellovibrionales bacterium]
VTLIGAHAIEIGGRPSALPPHNIRTTFGTPSDLDLPPTCTGPGEHIIERTKFIQAASSALGRGGSARARVESTRWRVRAVPVNNRRKQLRRKHKRKKEEARASLKLFMPGAPGKMYPVEKSWAESRSIVERQALPAPEPGRAARLMQRIAAMLHLRRAVAPEPVSEGA